MQIIIEIPDEEVQLLNQIYDRNGPPMTYTDKPEDVELRNLVLRLMEKGLVDPHIINLHTFNAYLTSAGRFICRGK